jgi:hypothetical protein
MSNHGRAQTLNIFQISLVFLGILIANSAVAQYGPHPRNVDPSEFNPGYYAMFGDWDAIPMDVLVSDDFVGAKILYLWRDLETAPGTYDFSSIEEDLAKLRNSGKRLWIQIEYTQWNGSSEPHTPKFMWSDASYGGDSRYYGNYRRGVQDGGWYPMFWNSKVRDRLVALVTALGARFNDESHIEGIVIGETSAEVPSGYNCSDYLRVFENVAQTAKTAFPSKSVIQMANFACFDVLAFMRWLVERGIGLGTPDTFNFKTDLTGGVYPLMYESRTAVPTGPDVQWDNYERNNMSVREIRDFAIAEMDPWYLFWQIREPYFTRDVLPAVFSRKLPAAERFYSGSSSAVRPMAPVLQD